MNLDLEHTWATTGPHPEPAPDCRWCDHGRAVRARVWCRQWKDLVPVEREREGCEAYASTVPF